MADAFEIDMRAAPDIAVGLAAQLFHACDPIAEES